MAAGEAERCQWVGWGLTCNPFGGALSVRWSAVKSCMVTEAWRWESSNGTVRGMCQGRYVGEMGQAFGSNWIVCCSKRPSSPIVHSNMDWQSRTWHHMASPLLQFWPNAPIRTTSQQVQDKTLHLRTLKLEVDKWHWKSGDFLLLFYSSLIELMYSKIFYWTPGK